MIYLIQVSNSLLPIQTLILGLRHLWFNISVNWHARCALARGKRSPRTYALEKLVVDPELVKYSELKMYLISWCCRTSFFTNLDFNTAIARYWRWVSHAKTKSFDLSEQTDIFNSASSRLKLINSKFLMTSCFGEKQRRNKWKFYFQCLNNREKLIMVNFPRNIRAYKRKTFQKHSAAWIYQSQRKMNPNPRVLLENCVCYNSVRGNFFIFEWLNCRPVMTKQKESRVLRSKFYNWRVNDYDVSIEVSNFLAK